MLKKYFALTNTLPKYVNDYKQLKHTIPCNAKEKAQQVGLFQSISLHIINYFNSPVFNQS